MAEKTEFLQAIDDAILDADSLEQFINGSDSETVLTRLSAEYPTLQKAIKELFENGGLPATPFKTKADMEASSLTDGDYAVVTEGGSNNGLYTKENGAWVLSKFSTLVAGDSKSELYIKHSMLDETVGKHSLIQSRNLYNPNTVTVGYSIDSDGELYERKIFQVSDFIEVTPNSYYSLSQSVSSTSYINLAVLYNDKKEQVARIPTPPSIRETGYFSFETTANTYYIRLSCQTIGDTIQARMLYKGDDQIPYEPYRAKKINPDAIDSTLFDAGYLLDKLTPSKLDLKQAVIDTLKDEILGSELLSTTLNLYDDNAEKTVGGINAEGQFVENSTQYITDFIPVDPSSDYTAYQAPTSRTYIYGVVCYDINKQFISRLSVSSVIGANNYAKVTTPANCSYVRLYCQNGDDGIVKRMFYKGSDPLPYELYKTKKIKSEAMPELNATSVTRKGDYLHFTGDKHSPAVLNFTDSYSKDDARNISTGNEPVTYADMVTWWGDLADEFPDYITKELVGYDSSGVYEVHSYHFNPPKITDSDLMAENRVRPRVMLIAFHIEQMNQLYPYLAMRELCRSWRDSPALASLRFEVEFVVMPYVHPWGFGNDYRLTSEGLNTNGDFPFLWSKVEGAVPNGDTPFATQEMRNVKKVAEKFKPHVFLDLHSNFASAKGSGLWAAVGEYEGYKSVVTRAVTSLYPKVVKADEQAPTLDKIAFFTYGSRARVAAGYGYMLGTTGGLIEIAKNYKGRPAGDGLYNDGLIFGSSMLLSLVTQCIAEYRDNGNPFDEDKYGTYDEILAEYGLSRDE